MLVKSFSFLVFECKPLSVFNLTGGYSDNRSKSAATCRHLRRRDLDLVSAAAMVVRLPLTVSAALSGRAGLELAVAEDMLRRRTGQRRLLLLAGDDRDSSASHQQTYQLMVSYKNLRSRENSSHPHLDHEDPKT